MSFSIVMADVAVTTGLLLSEGATAAEKLIAPIWLLVSTPDAVAERQVVQSTCIVDL